MFAIMSGWKKVRARLDHKRVESKSCVKEREEDKIFEMLAGSSPSSSSLSLLVSWQTDWLTDWLSCLTAGSWEGWLAGSILASLLQSKLSPAQCPHLEVRADWAANTLDISPVNPRLQDTRAGKPYRARGDCRVATPLPLCHPWVLCCSTVWYSGVICQQFLSPSLLFRQGLSLMLVWRGG